MKKTSIFVCALLLSLTAFCQDLEKIINEKEATRIETILSDDAMEGRATFTPGIERAADFISEEFRKAGLKPISGDSYRQEFSMVRPDIRDIKANLNGKSISEDKIIVSSTKPFVNMASLEGVEKVIIGKDENFARRAFSLFEQRKPTLVIVDPAHASTFGRLKARKAREQMEGYADVVFVLTGDPVNQFSLTASNNITQMKLANVVGVLPGRTKEKEYVIFSGHYDHIGIGKPQNGDSIYNGANDDASGITAIILLANYFAKTKENERTLVFAAFTAEEIGGYGSQYFSLQYDPEQVKAMFNIEMIGTDSKWGKNSAYITGYEKTDMGKILEKNLAGTNFTFHPDPYPDQNLFYRSDNATLARLGVPAHTISTSKMDNEPYYHTSDDEIETLDLANMTQIIRAIALSSRTIISGKDTPSRVDTSSLR